MTEKFSASVSDEYSNFQLSEKVNALKASLVSESHDETSSYLHVIDFVDLSESKVHLKDGSVWKIGYWYRGEIKQWKKDDRLKISQYFSRNYSNNIRLENVDASGCAWGVIEKVPFEKKCDWIARLFPTHLDKDSTINLILRSGGIFQGHLCPWKIRDPIFIFQNIESKEESFDLWNLKTNELITGWKIVGNEFEGSPESILYFKEAITSRVLGQEEAVDKIFASLLNYWAGFHDPKMPIGVFLFLGPSGVGKTELAKALGDKLFKTKNSLTRFDMSHFSEQHSGARLIGSPPGYVNHEEGGQLTQAILAKPNSIVLLDEIEKAHPFVRKIFLPVFDEGFITDNKNRKISCRNIIFIMTSNLCSQEIVELYKAGYTMEEVQHIIEPIIMEQLSPELYNRVIPLVFHPLTPDLMNDLVNLMLQEIIDRFASARKIKLSIGTGVKEYLIENGFHPTLGARPLKRLIQNQVVGFLSYAVIKESIPEGSHVVLSFGNNEWTLIWNSKR